MLSARLALVWSLAGCGCLFAPSPVVAQAAPPASATDTATETAPTSNAVSEPTPLEAATSTATPATEPVVPAVATASPATAPSVHAYPPADSQVGVEPQPSGPAPAHMLGVAAPGADPPGHTPDGQPALSAQELDSEARRRERASWSLAWDVAMPVAALHRFVSDVSPRGIVVAGEWPVLGGLRIGGTYRFNRFYGKEPRSTYELDSGAVTAKLYRAADIWSLAGIVRYRFLSQDSPVRPFVGGELGIAFLTATTLIADLSDQDNATGLLLLGEAGLVARLSSAVHVLFAARYNFTTASFRSYDNPSFGSLLLGVGWESWR